MERGSEVVAVAVQRSSEELLATGTHVLLAEVLNQSRDVAAPGEVRDLAEALAFLAPLVSPSNRSIENDPDRSDSLPQDR